MISLLQYMRDLHDMALTNITLIGAVSAVDNNIVNTRNKWDNIL